MKYRFINEHRHVFAIFIMCRVIHVARADIFDYIKVFYNRTRRHSPLGGISPDAFERASA